MTCRLNRFMPVLFTFSRVALKTCRGRISVSAYIIDAFELCLLLVSTCFSLLLLLFFS